MVGVVGSSPIAPTNDFLEAFDNAGFENMVMTPLTCRETL